MGKDGKLIDFKVTKQEDTKAYKTYRLQKAWWEAVARLKDAENRQEIADSSQEDELYHEIQSMKARMARLNRELRKERGDT